MTPEDCLDFHGCNIFNRQCSSRRYWNFSLQPVKSCIFCSLAALSFTRTRAGMKHNDVFLRWSYKFSANSLEPVFWTSYSCHFSVVFPFLLDIVSRYNSRTKGVVLGRRCGHHVCLLWEVMSEPKNVLGSTLSRTLLFEFEAFHLRTRDRLWCFTVFEL